jgi:hypothetical protein
MIKNTQGKVLEENALGFAVRRIIDKLYGND